MMLERKLSSAGSIPSSATTNNDDESALLEQIRSEALSVVAKEPVLCGLLYETVLRVSPASSAANDGGDLAQLITNTVCYRLLLGVDHHAICPITMRDMFLRCFHDTTTLEMGHSMMEAVQQDIVAVCHRDPAMDTPLQVILFSKGFAALVCHRASYRLYRNGSKFTALYLQSQASATFGVDIHPRAQLGQRLMLDHGTGIVIGETAQVGDGCTFLHGVTLGGTGKQRGDRHPKIGTNVLIGANASLLGNIRIGHRVKIGAGSVVLRPIPDGATAVGVPAKIIGKSNETKPGSDMDETLNEVSLFRNKSSDLESMVVSTRPKSTTTTATTTTARTNSDTEREYDSSDLPPTFGGETSSTTTTISDDESWDPTCPYRDYAAMAKRAPRGAFTMCTLHSILQRDGKFVTATEFFSCFFALDVDGKGYISPDDFRDRGYEAMIANTRLPNERARAIVDLYWSDLLVRRRRQSTIANEDDESRRQKEEEEDADDGTRSTTVHG